MAGLFRGRKNKVLTPVDGYDRWAASYLQESNPIKTLSDELVETMLPALDGKRVLDAGCGPGKFCLYAKKKNAVAISGMDISSRMIEEARSNCPSGTFTTNDLGHVEFPANAYDVVICALVLGHIEHLPPVLEKLAGTLDRGGVMIITDFHPFLTLMQAKRTFRDAASGQQFEVRHYLHLFEQYVGCFVRHGLSIEQWAEPQFNGTPAVFGVRVKKR